MIFEPCPDCVKEIDELIAAPGENSGPRVVLCERCGNTGLIPHGHENAGESEIC